MHFDSLSPAPPDAILGLTEAFRKDDRPNKVNLGVGVYQDDTGVTPVLKSVKEAEEAILESEKSKSYMPIGGSPDYRRHVQEMLFGAEHAVLKEQRARTAHTPGGTGALRVGADFLRQFAPNASVWFSQPTWANHQGIFQAAGFRAETYPYYSPATQGLDFDRMCDALKRVPGGDIVVLHVCCHNPTGIDLTADQWKTVGAIAADRGWIPFLDFAYQGFGDDPDRDRAGLLAMTAVVPELFVASSFSKNFGLYRERTGALTVISTRPDAVFSHVERTIRVNYSNPPAHGGLIVSTILSDAGLRAMWLDELKGMRERIKSVRAGFVGRLKQSGIEHDFSFIERQRGMFSFSGLSDEQVQFLRDAKGIYIVKGGRINVAGITSKNVDYLCAAIAEALSKGTEK